MRHIVSAVAIAASLAFGGCSTVESIESNLASPTTTQAATNVENFVTAVACALSTAAATAQGVETTLDSKGQTVTNIVYVASSAACKLIGGISRGTATVPASAVVAVTGQ